ncbi:MAG TPA: hypothetical protein VF406_00180 [Thermodesulfobacteriota bacterium]
MLARLALLVVLVCALHAASPPRAAAAWSHIRVLDLGRGIEYVPDPDAREAAWDWYATHVDAMEANGPRFASEMTSRNEAIRTFAYRIDLTACQHVGCVSTNEVDEEAADLPESYYMHFSETTTLRFVGLDGETVDTVTIPGCPPSQPVRKDCRVQLWMWDDARWAFNVNDPGFQAWQADRLVESLSSDQDGLLLDEHASSISGNWYWDRQTFAVSGGGVRELDGRRPGAAASEIYQPMVTSWLTVLRARAAEAGKVVLVNAAGWLLNEPMIDQVMATRGAFTEFLHRPDQFDGGSDQYERFIELMKELAAVGGTADLSGTLCYEGPSGYDAGNYGSAAARYRMWRLASYYLVREPEGSPGTIYFNPGLCVRPGSSDPLAFTEEWLPAYEIGFGSPDGEVEVLERGSYADGSRTCRYEVFSRRYTNGLVLVRTKDSSECTNWGDASAATVSLPREMRILREDGTLSDPTSTVTIRNAEALVLVD